MPRSAIPIPYSAFCILHSDPNPKPLPHLLLPPSTFHLPSPICLTPHLPISRILNLLSSLPAPASLSVVTNIRSMSITRAADGLL
jgi:hypothetical protein